MEFLARSWSISALQVSKALEKQQQQAESKRQCNVEGEEQAKQWPHFTCGSSHMVVDSILASSVCQRQLKGKTVGRWLKDKKAKRKEEQRAHNAEMHAAISVGGVAAAVAAIAAAAAHDHNDNDKENEDEEEAEKRMAVASAAALVAAHCVEMAMCMGADRQKMASLIGSAVNVKTPGDIITLTAGAATALRGAATFQARAVREAGAVITPYEKEKGSSNPIVGVEGFSGELDSQLHSDSEMCSQDALARGSELLKRTRKGALHWKVVSVYIKNSQVVVKLKSKHMAGTYTKKKKRVVFGVYKDLPAWSNTEMCVLGDEGRWYFGLETGKGVIQFECFTKEVHEMFTRGVEHLLSLVNRYKSNECPTLEL
ncbi:hypothetical protein SUGI_0842750 [Cryptomeria japonica]|nr:hypothetical protein SUGI_0842750 [Cryptomeria japonica]